MYLVIMTACKPFEKISHTKVQSSYSCFYDIGLVKDVLINQVFSRKAPNLMEVTEIDSLTLKNMQAIS